ncbi:hypothetical protein LX36DRAFT_684178 [Colletotrichum falcatum]|nr:hypothetical protein LX36DRAFT_684178 [Colletotrichum falcatum]
MPAVYHKTGESFYTPRAKVTVNKAIVQFTGQSKETTTIPTKPTPTSYKIWILAQSSYCLRWLWHAHGKGPYRLMPQAQPAQGNKAAKEAALTPTQRVITTLISLLPPAIYHVYLDNLFSSPRLFRALRQQGVGASGTYQKDSGINQTLVAEKVTEGQGIQWGKIHRVNQFS